MSEVDLEEDAQRFDKFLKDSDAGVQEAMRKADVESRARQDKASQFLLFPCFRCKSP